METLNDVVSEVPQSSEITEVRSMTDTEILDALEKSKLGLVFVGTCGCNTIQRVIEKDTPQTLPKTRLLVTDTDAKVQKRHIKDNTHLQAWGDDVAIHCLGASITLGRGAGAKSEVGKKAAETPQSIAVLTEFLESVGADVFVGGVGGGTCSGAMPVMVQIALDIAKKKNKPRPLAIVVTPDPHEGRTKRATEALEAIRALVPTIHIRNEHLREFLKELTPEEQESMTFKKAYEAVNKNSLVPMLLILREFIQEVGDAREIDGSDYVTSMGDYGNYVFFGNVRIDKSKPKPSAQEVAKELLKPRFQDKEVIKYAQVIDLLLHGPWLYLNGLDIIDEIKKIIAGDDLDRALNIEVHFKVIEEVHDDEMWAGLLLVADKITGANVKVEPEQRKQATGPVRVPQKQNGAPVAVPVQAPSGAAFQVITYRHKGEFVEKKVSSTLASRFNQTIGSVNASLEDINAVCDAVQVATNGCRPDLPPKFLPKDEVQIRKEQETQTDRHLKTDGRLFGFLRDRMSIGHN